jgi:hypothetical protein
MPTAVLRYRCRRCHQLSDGGTIESQKVETYLTLLLSNYEAHNQGSQVGIFLLHRCLDDGFGVSDLIGADIRDS